MRTYPPISISDALWSIQGALLREVTPDLRVVTVEVNDGIRLRFVYDRPIDEDLRTIGYMVDGEVSADFPDDDIRAVVETQMDGPITLTASEIPVYHRRETDHLDMPQASTHPGGHPDLLRDGELSTARQVRRMLGLHAVQAALLGEVTPDLRVVIIDPTDGVRIRMVYDHPIDAEIDGTVARIDAATRRNLHLDTTICVRAECVPDGRAPTADAEVYAYKRNEGEW